MDSHGTIDYKPQYMRLTEEWRQLILSGQLLPGTRLPSYSTLRSRYACSQDTLDKMHQQLEKEGLVERRASRGTFVADLRRRTAVGTVGVIGTALEALHVPYWGRLMAGIQREAARRNIEVLLANPGEGGIKWEKMDGALLAFGTSQQASLLSLPPTMPTVSLLLPLSGTASVIADDYEGMRLAMKHLLDLGHRRIAYLAAYPTTVHNRPTYFVQRRLAAYRDALEESGVTPREEWVRYLAAKLPQETKFRGGGLESMGLWLANGFLETGCTALLAHNDETAAGVLQALREAGLQVPGQVSVVGYDGAGIGEFCFPRLTTVRVPLEEMGREALTWLSDQLSSSDNGSREPWRGELHRILPATLHQGESTGPAST